MKILQITKYFYPAISFGGPVQCTYNLSKYLVNRGHKVTVYATDALDISNNTRIKDKYQQIDGIDVYYFQNIARFHGLFISPSMIHLLQKSVSDFDVVHLHEYRTFQNIAFYYNKKRTPYILSFHGEFSYNNESLDSFLLRRTFEYVFGYKLVDKASKLLALTQHEANQYLNGGVEPNKIIIIPNGLDLKEFSGSSQRLNFKEMQRIDNDDEMILFLGRINESKGIDTLVKAFSLLSKKRIKTKLVIAGPDDGFLGSVIRLVEIQNLKNKVIFPGSLNRKQVLGALNDAAVVVYASRQEGFPLVPLEAGIAGKPVIVSDYPAMDFVERGKLGLTVKYGSIRQLNAALEKILSNPDLSNKMGKNGQNFIAKNYSWDKIGKRIEAVYQSVLR